MMDASQILKDVEGIRFCEFTDKDVVRHPLVQRIVRAYEAYTTQNAARQQSLQFGQ